MTNDGQKFNYLVVTKLSALLKELPSKHTSMLMEKYEKIITFVKL